VSVRTLQNQFAEELDQTLTDYLKSRRLERARTELTDTPPGIGVGVTEIATRWGVTRLGCFVTDYRTRFGDSPSQTLRS
jgi:transcriptional regulator GlxA family with amidase domain